MEFCWIWESQCTATNIAAWVQCIASIAAIYWAGKTSRNLSKEQHINSMKILIEQDRRDSARKYDICLSLASNALGLFNMLTQEKPTQPTIALPIDAVHDLINNFKKIQPFEYPSGTVYLDLNIIPTQLKQFLDTWNIVAKNNLVDFSTLTSHSNGLGYITLNIKNHLEKCIENIQKERVELEVEAFKMTKISFKSSKFIQEKSINKT